MEINSPFTMVVIIVLLGVSAGVITNWLKLKAKQLDKGVSEDELFRMRKDVERLTERVRVLETIATDRDERLREDIRRLG